MNDDVATVLKKLDKTHKIVKKRKESSAEAEQAQVLAMKPLELTRYRNERNLMLYPFCSTSKRKRLQGINYKSSDGKRWLQVSASHDHGMVKIWDFDILRFALSKAGEVARYTDHFPSSVGFSAYECLKAIKKDPGNGKNIIWMREALRRLASTTYIGTIFRDDTKIEMGFTLIKYERVENGGKEDKIKITFDERLIESVRYYNGLLAIDEAVIKEESGVKKRLLELVKVGKGSASEWAVKLPRLSELCAYEGELKKFKHLLKSYTLPWKIAFSKTAAGDEKVTFL
jgi:hypothetical protein